PPPSTPTAAPAKPAPARVAAPPPAPPVTPSRNRWALLAIAAGLAGAMWPLLGMRKKTEPVAPGFNSPPAGGMAQLATQVVSNGLAEAAVSLGGARAPRLELRYIVEG